MARCLELQGRIMHRIIYLSRTRIRKKTLGSSTIISILGAVPSYTVEVYNCPIFLHTLPTLSELTRSIRFDGNPSTNFQKFTIVIVSWKCFIPY